MLFSMYSTSYGPIDVVALVFGADGHELAGEGVDASFPLTQEQHVITKLRIVSFGMRINSQDCRLCRVFYYGCGF